MNEIDKRVVQMEFDNKKFEQNVSETIKSLQKLDEALKINSSSEGLENTGKAAKKLDKELLSVNDTLDDTGKHFSTLEVVGVTALVSLTNAAIKASTKMVSTLNKPLSLAVSGGIARSQNLENAKFMLEGLGVAWKDIADDINYGVKNTAYGLDAAAKVASQLVASNVTLGDNMKNSLRAISGVAAMTNSTYEEIGSIFTTVAGQGKLMTMQLRQLEARGLNVAASLGKVMNKTEAEIRDMVTDGKIGFQDFADAMDEAFGEHAKEANKTFAGALSNTKAALSRLGEMFATPSFELFRKVLNSTIPVIDRVKTNLKPLADNYSIATQRLSEYITKFLESEELANALNKGGMAFYTWIAAIRTALESIGVKMPNFISAANALSTLFTKLILNGDKAINVMNTFKVFFQTLKLIHTITRSLFKLAMPFLNLAAVILGKIFGVSGNFFEIIYQVEVKLVRIINVVTTLLHLGINAFVSVLITLLNKIDLNYIFKGLQLILIVVVSLTSALINLAQIIFTITTSLIFDIPSAMSNILGIFGSLRGGAGEIAGLIKTLFGKKKKTSLEVSTVGLEDADTVKHASNEVKNANHNLDETNKKVASIDKNATRASKTVGNLGKVTKYAGINAEKSLTNVSKTLDTVDKQVKGINNEVDDIELVPSISDEAENTPSIFEKFFIKIQNVLLYGKDLLWTTTKYVAKFIGFVFDYLKYAIDLVWNELTDFVKSLNWVKIAIIAVGSLVAYTLYEILRSVHGVLSTIFSVGNLAKGYADRGVAAKLSAMVGVILAFGAVCSVILLIIDRIDVDKLDSATNSLIKIITKIGGIILALTVLRTIMSVFQSVSSVFQSMRMLMNAGRGQVIVKPITQLFSTLGNILGIIFVSMVAFSLLFGGEDGWDRFKRAALQVGIIIGSVLVVLGVFTLVMWRLSKGMYEFTTATSETGMLLKKTTSKVTTDPLEAISAFLRTMLPYFKMVFRNVIIFALLNKMLGEDAMKTATNQVLKVFWSVAGFLIAMASVLTIFQHITFGKTANVNKYAAVTEYLKAMSGLMESLFGAMRSVFRAVIILSILNKFVGAGNMIAAFIEVVGVLALVLGSVAILFRIARKYQTQLDTKKLVDMTNLVSSVVMLIQSLAKTVAVLAIISRFAGAENVAVAMGSLLALLITTFTFVAIIANNLSELKPKKFKDNVKQLKELINTAIIPLIGSVTILLSATALSMALAGIDTWDKMLGFMGGFALAFVGLAVMVKMVIHDTKDLNKKNLENIEKIVLTVAKFLSILSANIVVLAITMFALNHINTINGFANLGEIFIILTALLSMTSLIMYLLIKNKDKFDTKSIKAVQSIMLKLILVTTALVGLMASLGGLLIVVNYANVSIRSIGTLITLLIATSALISGVMFAFDIIEKKTSNANTSSLRNTIIIISAAIGVVASIIGLTYFLVEIAAKASGVDFGGISGMLTVIVGLTIFVAVATLAMAETITNNATKFKNIGKALLILSAIIAAVGAMISLMDIMAVTASALEGINFGGLGIVTAMMGALGVILTLIMLVTKEMSIQTIIVATLSFESLIGFFAVFTMTISTIADALEAMDHVQWKSIGKLSFVYALFVGLYGIITWMTSSGFGAIAILFATAVMGAISYFFSVTADAMLSIARAAEICNGISISSLKDVIGVVINDILPQMTKEVVSDIKEFASFVADLATAVSQLDKVKTSNSSGANITNMLDKLRIIAAAMPEIVTAFTKVDPNVARVINYVGDGMANLISSLSDIGNVSKASDLPKIGESLKAFCDSIAGINGQDISELASNLTTLGDTLKNLAKIAVISAAALFVASLVFNAAFASFSIGPTLFIMLLALLFSSLSDDDGPLGAFGSFVGGVMSQCDGLLGAFGRVLEGTADWGDKFKLTLAGIAAVALTHISSIKSGIAEISAAGGLNAAVKSNTIMPGIGLGVVGGLTGYYGASALGEYIGKYIVATNYIADPFDQLDAIEASGSEEAIKLLQAVHGDLSQLNNDQLKFVLDAFTTEYNSGVQVEEEDRATMIKLMEAISNQLIENGAEDFQVPLEIMNSKIEHWMENAGAENGVVRPRDYSREQLEYMAEFYSRTLAMDGYYTPSEWESAQQIYESLLNAIENGRYWTYQPGAATAEYYSNKLAIDYMNDSLAAFYDFSNELSDAHELYKELVNYISSDQNDKAYSRVSELTDSELNNLLDQFGDGDDLVIELLRNEFDRRQRETNDTKKLQNEEKNDRRNQLQTQKETLEAINRLKESINATREEDIESKRTGAASIGLGAPMKIGIDFSKGLLDNTASISKEVESKVLPQLKTATGTTSAQMSKSFIGLNDDVTDVIGTITGGISDLGDFLSSLLGNAYDMLPSHVKNLLSNWGGSFSEMWDYLKGYLPAGLSDTLDEIIPVMESMMSDGGDIVAGGFGDSLFNTLVSDIVEAFNAAWKAVGQGIYKGLGALYSQRDYLASRGKLEELQNVEDLISSLEAQAEALNLTQVTGEYMEAKRDFRDMSYEDFYNKWVLNRKSGGGDGTGDGTSPTTNDLAGNVSKSSGTGSGINDISKGGLGSNTGSITNIDSNNVTYNYTQNNYSPEALSRIDIYRQTNNQLKTVFDALKG